MEINNKIVYIKTESKSDQIKAAFDEIFERDHKDDSCNNFYYLISQDDDYSFKELIDIISVDISADISIFESLVIDDKKNIEGYLSLFRDCNKRGFFNTTDLCLYYLTNDNKRLKELSAYFINALENDNDLINVCKAMFKNDLNVSRAAKDAYMHRNTIINKLDIIRKKTNLNIQEFSDAMAAYALINYK